MRAQIIKVVCLLVCVAAMCGCSVTSYVTTQFDVLRPAYYTLPSDIDSVVIVNGVRVFNINDSLLMMVDEETRSVQREYLDKMPSMVCNVLGNSIVRGGYLSAKMESVPMDMSKVVAKVDSLCKVHRVDAILVMSEAEYSSALRVEEGSGMSGMYIAVARMMSVLKSRFTVVMPRGVKFDLEQRNDTLYWDSAGESISEVVDGLPSFREKYFETVRYVGDVMAMQLSPSWERVTRKVLTSSSAKMIDASQWVGREEWEKARDIWYQVYEDGSEADKVRSAINLAIYYERNDDAVNAAKWSSCALDMLAGEKKKRMSSEEDMAKRIFERMMQRQRELKELDKQMEA